MYNEPSSLQHIALIVVHVANSNDILLLQGEKDYAPNVATLIGGKVGDDEETNKQNLDEMSYTWITAYREWTEEVTDQTKPDNLQYVCKITYHDQNPDTKDRVIDVWSAELSEDDLSLLNPPSGDIIRLNLNDIENAKGSNPYGISPLNLDVLNVYIENRETSGTKHEKMASFPSIADFQEQLLMQRRL